MDYHDVLAAFGAGSAHPGGFRGTLDWLGELAIAPGAQVLEVGCGTGRTACAIQERFGAQVTGVDIREAMVDKAKRRAEALALNAVFLQSEQADVLPFPEHSFDLIVIESVTIFNRMESILQEYFRVLRSPGAVIDTEMAAAYPLAPALLREVRELYGAVRVPTLKEWKTLFGGAGFSPVQILRSGAVRAVPFEDELHDAMAIVSPEAFSGEASKIVDRNQQLMADHGKWFVYGVFRAVKE